MSSSLVQLRAYCMVEASEEGLFADLGQYSVGDVALFDQYEKSGLKELIGSSIEVSGSVHFQ